MSTAIPRIILTVTNDLTYDQRMIRIAQSLSEAGYRVVLVGRERKNSLPLESRDFRQHRITCFFEKGKLFYLEFNWRLYHYLISQRLDGICAIDLDTIVAVYFASKYFKVPRFFDAHEYFEEVPEVVHRPLVKAVWEKLATWFIPRFYRTYTVCESLASIFQKKYGIPFSVVRNLPFSEVPLPSPPVNQEVIEQVRQLSEIKTILLYQGALNDGRGLDEMLDAMQHLEDSILLLAGDGDLGSHLHARVAREYLRKKVIFLGYVTPLTLREITPFATLGLNLLEQRGKSYYYSLANKTFDYIQAGVPALHPNFPEYQQLMKEHQTGVLVHRLDGKYLATTIKELLENGPRYSVLKANCGLAKNSLIWEKEQERLTKIYDTIYRINSNEPMV